MSPLKDTNRWVRKSAPAILTMAGIFTVATTTGFAAAPVPETIQATYIQAGNATSITLIVYSYSTATELQALSQAFQQGEDQELASALSRTKAVGRCVIAGDPSYDVAFIQLVLTPTGRQITFITSRPRPPVESDPPATPQLFDLAVGRFELNDIDPTKSTGFLFPATKLVADEQGVLHYDLTGASLELVNVVYSRGSTPPTGPQVADAADLKAESDQAAINGH